MADCLQNQTPESVTRVKDRSALKAIDDEHARLEDLIEPLDFGDDDDASQEKHPE